MATLLQTASGIDDLLRVRDASSPYRFDRIFAGEGWIARRLHKRRLELLRRLEPVLEQALESGEQVEQVSWGIEFSFVEAYFMGLWHYLLNRRVLVLTDRRLLLIQIDSRSRPRPLESQVRLSAVTGTQGALLGAFAVRLRDGRRITLSGLPGRDRRLLRERLSSRGAETAATSAARGREHLCPHCHAPAAPFGGERPERCPTCRGTFKSSARAGWLSLAFPGLGDLYLGHRALAAVEVLGALVAWGVLLPVLLSLAFAEDATSGDGVAALVAAGVIFLLVHGVDALVTAHVARKGLYPATTGSPGS